VVVRSRVEALRDEAARVAAQLAEAELAVDHARSRGPRSPRCSSGTGSAREHAVASSRVGPTRQWYRCGGRIRPGRIFPPGTVGCGRRCAVRPDRCERRIWRPRWGSW
jgi:hypothetical protein